MRFIVSRKTLEYRYTDTKSQTDASDCFLLHKMIYMILCTEKTYNLKRVSTLYSYSTNMPQCYEQKIIL